jgi:hypothetical protein
LTSILSNKEGIIHPHPNPLELEEKIVPLTSILSLGGARKPERKDSP